MTERLRFKDHDGDEWLVTVVSPGFGAHAATPVDIARLIEQMTEEQLRETSEILDKGTRRITVHKTCTNSLTSLHCRYRCQLPAGHLEAHKDGCVTWTGGAYE